MQNAKLNIFALCAAALMLVAPARAADIVIGVPNWTSVQVTGEVLKVVLEDNLGLEVETQTANNAVIFEAMERGSMHVHPEVWLPNQDNLHRQYVREKGVVDFNPHSVESRQGLCATRMTAEKHGVTSVHDLTDPDKTALFDTNGDGLGEMWIGPQGWASTEIWLIRAKSHGFAETLELVTTDETLANAALDEAVRRERPYVLYCYTPHTMFTKHDLVFLEEPPHDPAKWRIIRRKDDPDWLEKSDAGVAFPLTHLHIHWAKSLDKSHPDAAALLANVKLSAEQVTEMMFEVDEKKRGVGEVAREWVDKNGALVESWLGG